MMDWVLSIVMLAAIALLIGAYFTWRRGFTRQAVLMAALAVVMLGNVAIWTVPDDSGTAPLERIPEGPAATGAADR